MKKSSKFSPAKGACVESLETRALMAFTFQFDYRYDTSGFFDSQAKRDVLTAAGKLLSTRIADQFAALSPSDGNTLNINLRNPQTGESTVISNPTIAQDTIIVFVGARDLGTTTLGQGGPSGWSASGTTAWTSLVRGRGQSGATATPRTDFAPKAGTIAFDVDTNWFFGTTTSGLQSTQTDFYSVAAHELGHVLGVGAGSETWPAYASGGFFNGPASKAAYGGPVPLMSDGVHFKDNITSGGQETALDPTLKKGVRKVYTPLDYAALDDVGYDIIPAGTINGSVFTDLDNDGYRDSNEAGISGVTVFLDTNKDGKLTTGETSTTTDVTGRYTFVNLLPNTYRVAEVLPGGYVAVKPSNAYRSVIVSGGQVRNSQDFAIAKNNNPGKVTGSLFNDLNGNGQRDSGEGLLVGWRVFVDADKDGVYDTGEIATTTNSFGTYTLTLSPGAYRIAASTQTGFRRSSPSTGFHDVTIDPGVTVTSRSFGFTQNILLSGRVFKDLDGDGLKDSNESYVSGWRIYIDSNKNGIFDTGEVNTYSQSGDLGYWQIGGLAAGTYQIRVVPKTGYALKSPAVGYYNITLSAGGIKSTLNWAESPV